MDRFGLGFLKTVKDAKDQADSASAFMNEGGEFNKKNANQFLDAVYTELSSPQTSPTSKLMTLHVLKQLTYYAEVRFFSLFSNHKALQFLLNQAKSVDPKKNVSEKGLKKFINQPETGRDYMKLLLQLTNFWGQKFAKGKNSEPTKYKKNLTQLKNLGVMMPENYEIFDTNQYKLKKKGRQGGGSTQALANSLQAPNQNVYGSTPTGNPASGVKPAGKIGTQLRYTRDKITMFMADLEQAQDPDQIQNLIHTSHAAFDKQKTKYETRGEQAQSQQDEQILTTFFAIDHFLTEESKYYNQYIPVNDYISYISQMKLLNQTTFDKKQPLSRFPAAKAEEVRPLLGAPNIPVAPNRMGSTGSSQPSATNSRALLNNFYSKLQERSRSKSPAGGMGFKSVQMDLQREKQMAKKNPVRRTVSKSPKNLRVSGDGLSRSNASNLRQSKVHPIFSSPPNQYASPKNFEGETIMESKDLMRALFNIKKDQGTRRFKISNFRQKNPLFENEQIQVGYKSQAVYEQIGQFNHFIFLNLYIGNKTDDGIKDFQVQYKADSNQLLYANPRSVDSIIPAGYQNKHDLMITPIGVPYSFMTMNISYKFKNTGILASIVLPNSVLKYASYMKISRADFDNNWRSARKFKTNPFRLCKHLAPDSFNKWIPVLDNITRYSQFSKEGSETDLQMFCMVIMLQKYEAVLKINIRPNLEVVLQLGVLDNNQEGLEYFKFYLETLQLILKQIEL